MNPVANKNLALQPSAAADGDTKRVPQDRKTRDSIRKRTSLSRIAIACFRLSGMCWKSSRPRS